MLPKMLMQDSGELAVGRHSLVHFWLEHADVGQAPVLLRKVQTVANHKVVWDGEGDVVHRDVDLPARGLVQKTHNAHLARIHALDEVHKVSQCVATVDDVLHDDHSAPLDVLRIHKCVGDVHLAAALRGLAVGRGLHKLHLRWDAQVLEQVGREHESAREHAQHHHVIPPSQVLRDLVRDLNHPLVDLRCREQNALDITVQRVRSPGGRARYHGTWHLGDGLRGGWLAGAALRGLRTAEGCELCAAAAAGVGGREE
mmetsp:Transcript_30136/g.75961  ORF Transcript_30136/g.75961 Transcript_30136/m.75961 type:complete len:256 (+) Transcript_30136:217-984(+)